MINNVKESSSGKRNIIADRNLNLHKENNNVGKGITKDKVQDSFFILFNCSEDNYLK